MAHDDWVTVRIHRELVQQLDASKERRKAGHTSRADFLAQLIRESLEREAETPSQRVDRQERELRPLITAILRNELRKILAATEAQKPTDVSSLLKALERELDEGGLEGPYGDGLFDCPWCDEVVRIVERVEGGFVSTGHGQGCQGLGREEQILLTANRANRRGGDVRKVNRPAQASTASGSPRTGSTTRK